MGRNHFVQTTVELNPGLGSYGMTYTCIYTALKARTVKFLNCAMPGCAPFECAQFPVAYVAVLMVKTFCFVKC